MRSAHCAIEDRTRDALLEVGKVRGVADAKGTNANVAP